MFQTGLKPPCILVDCSEVELGRSLGQRGTDRGDNDSTAVKNRLTTYRIVTLPTLDHQLRLHIVHQNIQKIEKNPFMHIYPMLIS